MWEGLDDGSRHDAAALIVLVLTFTAFERLADGCSHGRRHAVGVQEHRTVGVTGCASDGLEQRSFVAQEALPIRIKDGDQTDLRNVQPFS